MRAEPIPLPYRAPYDWRALAAFLGARATPGVEAVSPDAYRRTIDLDGHAVIEIRRADGESGLTLRVSVPHPGLPAIVDRVRRMYDLDVEPAAVVAHLGSDPLLSHRLAAHPGIRVPGAWDPFELAVRAVLGQQVSVRAATTLAGRLAEAHGSVIAKADGLNRLFPTAKQLVDAQLERLGVMPARATTIRALARAVLDGRVTWGGDAPARSAALRRLPGIGPWTASYIAMRAFGDRDAFPSGDLILRRAAGDCSPRALEARAEAWRPWRAYAVMLLWQDAVAPPGRVISE